jgi:hypothetical protein
MSEEARKVAPIEKQFRGGYLKRWARSKQIKDDLIYHSPFYALYRPSPTLANWPKGLVIRPHPLVLLRSFPHI